MPELKDVVVKSFYPEFDDYDNVQEFVDCLAIEFPGAALSQITFEEDLDYDSGRSTYHLELRRKETIEEATAREEQEIANKQLAQLRNEQREKALLKSLLVKYGKD